MRELTERLLLRVPHGLQARSQRQQQLAAACPGDRQAEVASISKT